MEKVISLPDEVIEGFRQIAEAGEGHQWAMGDYLVEMVDEFRLMYERAGVRRARAAMFRELASKTGCDTSTLRDRESVARVVLIEDRTYYAPLTYSQLRACKSAGNLWRDYANWALDNLPASVSAIRHKIHEDKNGQPVWISRLERVITVLEAISVDMETPSNLKYVCGNCMIALEEEQKRCLG
jgi:hypothetical protein